jgi:molybdate transport system substrate-binding protein
MNTLHTTVAAIALLTSSLTCAAEIRVAVAANFMHTMKEITAVFEKDTGHKVALTQGSTGKLYAQISQGAPFDVFLSADDETPGKLAREGKAIANTQFTYAIGRLVLWSPRTDLVDEGGQVLKTDKFRFLAMANARVAPYGRAAVQTMQKLGVLSLVEPRAVQGESITQTFQFVSTGNAQLGFVALSQIINNGKITPGSAWIVPESMHESLKQDAILLKSAKDATAAIALLNFMQSDKAKKIIAAHGYQF